MTTSLTLSSFLYFLLFCATMTFSPGPMTLLLLSLGLKDGLRSSIPAQIGASVSYLISILIFAVGFSELIKGNLAITQTVQFVGVAYILYLAYKQWTSNGVSIDRAGAVEGSRSLFGKGLLTGFFQPQDHHYVQRGVPAVRRGRGAQLGGGHRHPRADLSAAAIRQRLLVLLLRSAHQACAGKPPAPRVVAARHGGAAVGGRINACAGFFPLSNAFIGRGGNLPLP